MTPPHPAFPRPNDDELVARYREAVALEALGPSAESRMQILEQAQVQARPPDGPANPEPGSADDAGDAAAAERPECGSDEPTSLAPAPMDDAEPAPAESPATREGANDRRWFVPAVASLAVLGLAGLLVLQFDRSAPHEQRLALGPNHGTFLDADTIRMPEPESESALPIASAPVSAAPAAEATPAEATPAETTSDRVVPDEVAPATTAPTDVRARAENAQEAAPLAPAVPPEAAPAPAAATGSEPSTAAGESRPPLPPELEPEATRAPTPTPALPSSLAPKTGSAIDPDATSDLESSPGHVDAPKREPESEPEAPPKATAAPDHAADARPGQAVPMQARSRRPKTDVKAAQGRPRDTRRAQQARQPKAEAGGPAARPDGPSTPATGRPDEPPASPAEPPERNAAPLAPAASGPASRATGTGVGNRPPADPALAASTPPAVADPEAASPPPAPGALTPPQRLLAGAALGRREMVQAALHEGAGADSTDDAGHTAMMLAARRGDVGMVRALIAAGAATSRTDRSGLTAAGHARRAGHEALANWLADQPAPGR